MMNDWRSPDTYGGVCFSIDDVHPAKSSDPYEAGGDLGRGALRHVEWLLERHPNLHVTLFTTPDWREISPKPTRKLLSAIPHVRDRFYLARRQPKGTMRLDRHPEFIRYLKSLPRTETAIHGLHHCHKGPNITVEFQETGYSEATAIISEIKSIFAAANLDFSPGLCPPGWTATSAFLAAMADAGLTFIASARDVTTTVSDGALTGMSGMRGVSLIHPQLVHAGRLVHICSNFQATSPIDRALAIIESGGLLAIKAHIIKNALGHTMLDGLDETYRNYLDLVFTILENRYGDRLSWTSMGAVAARILGLKSEV